MEQTEAVDDKDEAGEDKHGSHSAFNPLNFADLVVSHLHVGIDTVSIVVPLEQWICPRTDPSILDRNYDNCDNGHEEEEAAHDDCMHLVAEIISKFTEAARVDNHPRELHAEEARSYDKCGQVETLKPIITTPSLVQAVKHIDGILDRIFAVC